MSPISITFATAANPGFQWLDSFKNLKNDEIKEIVIMLRGAQAAFLAELADRYKGCEKEHEDYCAMICESAEIIDRIGFSEMHEKYLHKLEEYLTGRKDAPEERKEFKAARQYLWLVSRVLGWPYALLILCALGRWRLQNFSDEQRARILKYVAQNSSSLHCPRLEEKAIQCKLQQIHVKLDVPFIPAGKKRRRKRDNSEDATTTNRRVSRNIRKTTLTNDGLQFPCNEELPSANVTTRKKYTSNLDKQTPPYTILEFSSQPSSNKLTLTSEHRIHKRQPAKLTIGSQKFPSPPPADVGQSKISCTSDLVLSAGHSGFSTPADSRIADALALETNFNRNSKPICQRPYGSPIFLRVIEGDIFGVYDILISCEGSLWDHDPYGLGILYYAAHYCWKGLGMNQAMAMYQALLELGAQDDDFASRTDEIGNRPIETINDWLLASRARGYSTVACEDEGYKSSRGFSKLHEVLLKIDLTYHSIDDFLNSLSPEVSSLMVDLPDAFGRTPLAWAVEYGLTGSIEQLLKFGADPNQLRSTKDGGFSPLIHIAIAGPRSSWMDDDIVETIRILLTAGADVNAVDHEGWTALHIAASWSLFRETDMLNKHGRGRLAWNMRTLQGETIFDVCDNTDYRARYGGMMNCPMTLA